AARADVRIVREAGRARGYLQITRRVGEFGRVLLAEPAGWARHQQEEIAYVQAEERRLLYVAGTRAKELLVVSRVANGGSRSTGSWASLDPYLTSAPQLAMPAQAAPSAGSSLDLSPAIQQAARREREEQQHAARQPSWEVAAVTGTAHPGTRPQQPEEVRGNPEPDTGMAWGQLVHVLLESAMRGPQRDRAHLQRVAQWFTMEQPGLRAVISSALDTIERVMASDVWRRAMGAEERLVEVPFAVKVPAEGKPPRILHGVIDLAFRTADGWELVDYKTDQVDVETLVELYGDQVRQYAKQWASLTAARVKYAGLYSVREGRCTRSLTEA
ncbi:MAG TPA: PD-(D/E)XK nuclease family protein, partial [Candidatus Sulfotelmatobacter sp.]|nr:PD-(D/E)XK nuclease family protein [Candidatus Sulfotelmatobacter sp.]